MGTLEKQSATPPKKENIVHVTDSEDKVRLQIKLSPLLDECTCTKGQYEKALKEALLELGMEAKYEAVWFEVPPDSAHKNLPEVSCYHDYYPPDFITNILINGKQVILEPHSGVDTRYLSRMGRLREKWGNLFYFIVIHSNLKDPSEANIEFDVRGENGKSIDELWHMPKIKMDGKRIYNQEDYDRWKVMIKAGLRRLIDTRTEKILKADELSVISEARRKD